MTTNPPSEVTRTSVMAGGTITDDGGLPVLDRGICWDTTENPDLSKNFIQADTEDESFSIKITGLKPNTVYFIRAYATNELGTTYANELTFTTLPVSTGTIVTIHPSSISLRTALTGGKIIDDGDAVIIQKGVCWSTSPNPDLEHDTFTEDGTGTEEFTSTITGLTPGTQYFVRAYSINSAGISYGSELSFNTKISDIQNNLYSTVTIGSQVWMAENLRTTRYNDNSLIPNVKESSNWINLSTPAYCWFGNDANKADWGALYNWFTVQTGRLCPTGWHVPTDDDFKTLELYLNLSPEQVGSWYWRGTDQGSRLKSTSGWDEGENGTNSSGFSALPYGYRFAGNGDFNGLGILTYWWSSDYYDEYAIYRRIDGNESGIYRYATSKKGGKYVRCIKTK
ncbi:MAG TPA: FISUMP domain-containing protein [Bacteroidales bacterium]|nr:FISUMP domain-containing protein [Bacteroidales bacterium]